MIEEETCNTSMLTQFRSRYGAHPPALKPESVMHVSAWILTPKSKPPHPAITCLLMPMACPITAGRPRPERRRGFWHRYREDILGFALAWCSVGLLVLIAWVIIRIGA